jgi:uncharacterized protein YegP (UPF0339 family)
MTIHTLPVNDLKPHVETSACECHPRVETTNGGIIVVHNSYDGREILERAIDSINEN